MTAPAGFRRVVVSVSADTGSRVFASAAEIARSFSADLAGLFIEDERVLGIADLPFAAEIAGSGAARPLRRGDVERAYRTASAGARRRFEAAARAAHVRATFERERGAVGTIVGRVAGRGDLVVVVEPGRAIERACAVNASMLSAACASRGAVLYAPEAALAWAGGVAAYLDGTADRRVLAAALWIASVRAVPLHVINAGSGPEPGNLVDDIARQIDVPPPALTTSTAGQDGLAATLAAASELDRHLVVAARGAGQSASPDVLRTLAARRRAPVLLIAPDDPED